MMVVKFIITYIIDYYVYRIMSEQNNRQEAERLLNDVSLVKFDIVLLITLILDTRGCVR